MTDSIWDIGSNDTPPPESIPQKGVAHVLGVIGEGALHAVPDAAGFVGDIGHDVWQMGKNAMYGTAPSDISLPGLGPVSQKVNESFAKSENEYTNNNTPAPQNTAEKYANVASRGLADIWTMGGPEATSVKGLASGASAAVAAQGTYDLTGSSLASYAAALVGGAVPHVMHGATPSFVAKGLEHPDFAPLSNVVVPALEGGGSIEHPLVSKKGAEGPMQTMPTTERAPGYGVKPSDGTQEDNVRMGKDYLAAMLGKYGDPDKALAAYNAGPSAVDHAIEIASKTGEDWFNHLPNETKHYVLDGMTKLRAGGTTGGAVSPINPADLSRAMGEPLEGAHPSQSATEVVPDEGNVVDLSPKINDKLDAENTKLIDNNLDIANKIHQAIDDGRLTEEHLPNVIKARDNVLSIRSEFGQDMPPEQLDKVNENIETLNHAIDRLGGEDPIADKPQVTSSVDTTAGARPEPANDINVQDAEDRSGVYGNGKEPPKEPPSGGNDVPPSGSEPPAGGEEPPEKGLFERMSNALKTAKTARTEQQKLYGEERSKRVAEIAKARQYTSGEQGFHVEKAQLKGALPTADYGPSEHFSQGDVEQLFNHVKNHPALGYLESIKARGGLAKLLQGELPQPAELRLLAKTMPSDLIKGMLKEKSMMSKISDTAASVFNVPKALMASFDMSAPLRQGVFMITRKQFYTSLVPMVRAMVSPKYAEAVIANIHSDPLYPAMEESGLAIPKYQMGHNGGPPLDELMDREEPYMTNLAQRIPLVGIGVRASERAYNTFVYKVRADTFRSLYDLGRAEGKLWTKEPLKDLSRFINSFTGRGDLGKYNNAAPMLNAAFFSPRLLKSRIDAINPAFYASLDPFVRKEAIKSILGFTAVAVTILGLAKLAGAEVSTDITKADGWKIKIGNTRHDILGGEQQLIRLVANVAIYTYDKGEQLEKTGSIHTRHKDKIAADKIGQFFRNKESPDVSFAHDFFAGRNSVGQRFNLKNEAVERVTPMFAQDVNDIRKDGGPIVQAFPGLFGESIQTYQDKKHPVSKNPSMASGGDIWSM